MVHVSEILADKRVERPQDVLRTGQVVQAKVLEIDRERRQMKLSMKQLIPTGLGEYLEEHKVGDAVSGRVVSLTNEIALVELGEGIRATCAVPKAAAVEASNTGGLDLSALSSMLNAKWKSGGSAATAPAALEVGQVKSFTITKLDKDAKSIELKLG